MNHNVLSLYLVAKALRQQRPIMNLHQDGNARVLEGRLQRAERRPHRLEGGSAHDKVQVAGIVALAVHAAAVCPNLAIRHVLPQEFSDGIAPARSKGKASVPSHRRPPQ